VDSAVGVGVGVAADEVGVAVDGVVEPPQPAASRASPVTRIHLAFISPLHDSTATPHRA
jgi:hypothetical protein